MRGDLLDGRHLAQPRERAALDVQAQFVGREQEFLGVGHGARRGDHDVAAHPPQRELDPLAEAQQRGEREDDERREQRDRNQQRERAEGAPPQVADGDRAETAHVRH